MLLEEVKYHLPPRVGLTCQKVVHLKVAQVNILAENLGIPRIPSYLKLRPYQQQAIDNWFANRGRGTLKMATGTGKTITALAIATQLHQEISLQEIGRAHV